MGPSYGKKNGVFKFSKGKEVYTSTTNNKIWNNNSIILTQYITFMIAVVMKNITT